MHFFPKSGIAEFKIEAFDIKIGDQLLITGATTGVKELELTEMMVEDVVSEIASKGNSCTIPTGFKIRASDKLYKIVQE